MSSSGRRMSRKWGRSRLNEDRRPKTKDLEKEDPLENEDLEKEDPLEKEDLENEVPLKNEDPLEKHENKKLRRNRVWPGAYYPGVAYLLHQFFATL